MDFWIAIPDSSLADEQAKREKSVKIAQIARACAIFRVTKIFLYRDRERDYSQDRKLLKLILEFMDTPQYLRRILYKRIPELGFAGLLPPLKAPHHRPFVGPEEIKVGEVRQAVVAKVKGNYYVDAGLGKLIHLDGSAPVGKRITVKFTSAHPALRCKAASDADIREYWGYEVKEAQSLTELLKGIGGMVVMTSRRGEPLVRHHEQLRQDMKQGSSILVVFGSPNRGAHEILADERRHPKDFTKYVLNFFPGQAVETVRLEEAVLGCLSLLNHIAHE